MHLMQWLINGHWNSSDTYILMYRPETIWKRKKSKKSVADPGERPGSSRYVSTKMKKRKNFLWRPLPPPYLRVWMAGPPLEGLDPPLEITTWTTKIHYFIFWQVNYHFRIPFISPIVCIYGLKYPMSWSGTIYNIINYKESTRHEITRVKKVETA